MIGKPKCELCGEPMPDGEEMFKYHGYSGNCPKPPKAMTNESTDYADPLKRLREFEEGTRGPYTSLATDIRKVLDSIETLLAWKQQMMALQATWDVQAVGRLLNLPLGSNILPAIQPAIETLLRERDEARAELSAMRAARDEVSRG